MNSVKNKMKIILYIDVMYRGGAQRVMSILANHLSKKHQVILITDFMSADSSLEYEIHENVKRLFLKKDNKGNSIVKNVSRVRNLRKIVKDEKPDIILSFLGRPNIRMLLSTLGLKCKKIVSVRNDPKKEYGCSFFKKTMANLIFLLADGCVFQTSDASKYFYKKTQKKSKIIFNPVDNKFYDIKPSENKKNIITVGRLEPQKNHKLLSDSFEKIHKEFPEDDLILYGDGSLREKLEDYVKVKKISHRVHFMGNIDSVENVLSDAKVFVLSSDYEGMPNALMEAMAAGVACISTDCPCGGPKTLIQNENQGLLVSCNDITALVSSLKKILSSDFQKIGINSRNRAKEFRTDKVLKEWNDYLFK